MRQPCKYQLIRLLLEKKWFKAKKILDFLRQKMSKEAVSISGYVVALPKQADSRQANVAIVQDGVEYRVMPRGAGVDLIDEVNVPVEVIGSVEEDEEGIKYVFVRGYKVLEDDEWLDE